MSRSRKKRAVTGFTAAKSEKQDKRIINRVLRHKVKSAMKTKNLAELEEFIEPKKDEIMDRWHMAKDGKQDCTGTPWEKKALRK